MNGNEEKFVNADIPETNGDFTALDGMDKNAVDGNALTPEQKAEMDRKAKEKKEQKELKDKLEREVLEETKMEDDAFGNRVRTLSDHIEVIKPLCFKDNGNMVEDKSGSKRVLVKTSKNVGYKIRNNSNIEVPYVTETFAKNEEGAWVGTQVEALLKPGEEICLARKWMTLFASQPELSLKFSNGRMLRGSATMEIKADMDSEAIDRELEAYYFAFFDADKKVNDDKIKEQIGEPIVEIGPDGKEKTVWIVKDEYASVFGFLNNVKEKAPRKSAKEKDEYDKGVYAANFINKTWRKKNSKQPM